MSGGFSMCLTISLQNKMKAFNRQNGLCASCGNKISFSQNADNSAKLIFVLTAKNNKNLDKSFLQSDENCIYLCGLCVNHENQELNAKKVQDLIYSHGNKENTTEQRLLWQKKIIPMFNQNSNNDNENKGTDIKNQNKGTDIKNQNKGTDIKNQNQEAEKQNFQKSSPVKTPETNAAKPKNSTQPKKDPTKRAVIIGNFKKNTQVQKTSEPIHSAQKIKQNISNESKKPQVEEDKKYENICNNNASSQLKEQKIQTTPEIKEVEQQKISTPKPQITPEKAKAIEYRRLLQSKIRKMAKKAYR